MRTAWTPCSSWVKKFECLYWWLKEYPYLCTLVFKTLVAMKKDIHPKDYRLVVFKDMSNDYTFISKSTVRTKETIVMEDGVEYPLVKLEISHTSHPFYTGKMKLVDTAGRVDKFKSRYQKHYDKKSEK
jgi:large subunit ribosomal protein L31